MATQTDPHEEEFFTARHWACFAKFKVPASRSGDTIRCKKCGDSFTLPRSPSEKAKRKEAMRDAQTNQRRAASQRKEDQKQRRAAASDHVKPSPVQSDVTSERAHYPARSKSPDEEMRRLKINMVLAGVLSVALLLGWAFSLGSESSELKLGLFVGYLVTALVSLVFKFLIYLRSPHH